MEFEGLEIMAYRSKESGLIVLEIITGGLSESDTYPENGVPKIIVYVNDERNEIGSKGEWIQGEGF